MNVGDAFSRDLRLLRGSPGIDASRLDSAMPIAVGNVQCDAAADLGAYEHGVSPEVPRAAHSALRAATATNRLATRS